MGSAHQPLLLADVGILRFVGANHPHATLVALILRVRRRQRRDVGPVASTRSLAPWPGRSVPTPTANHHWWLIIVRVVTSRHRHAGDRPRSGHDRRVAHWLVRW